MEVTLKKYIIAFMVLISHTEAYTQYDPSKPLNTETYEFYKGNDWKKTQDLDEYDDNGNYIVEIDIQDAMLEYKQQLPSFNTKQKQLFTELEELTEKIFALSYKWHTETMNNEEEAEGKKLLDAWQTLDGTLQDSLNP